MYCKRKEKNNKTTILRLYTLKNAGLFQAMFVSNVNKPNHWFKLT